MIELVSKLCFKGMEVISKGGQQQDFDDIIKVFEESEFLKNNIFEKNDSPKAILFKNMLKIISSLAINKLKNFKKIKINTSSILESIDWFL